MSAQVSGPFFGAGAPGGGGRRNNNSGGRGGRGGRGRIHRYYRRDGPRCNFCNARGHVQKDCRRMQSIGMFMDQVNASTTLAAQNIILGRVAQHGYHQQPVNQQQQEWQQQQPQQQLPPPQLLLPAPQEGQQEGEQQQQQPTRRMHYVLNLHKLKHRLRDFGQMRIFVYRKPRAHHCQKIRRTIRSS